MTRLIHFLAWAWLIIVGGLLITPGGVFCIACGAALQEPGFIGRPATLVIGIVAIVLGIAGFATAGARQVGAAAISQR
jgi:hypothetical protein